MAEKIPVHAVVRFNQTPSGDPKDMVTVTEVLPTAEEAVAEAERLNGLVKEGRGTIYFAVYTRFYPDGRHVDAVD